MSDWIKESETRLLINDGFGLIRLLIGAPFLLLGLYFFYQYLIMSIVAYIQADDWAGLFGNSLGWLVTVFITLIFLVPGWLIAFFRSQVIIDTSAGELVQMQDFLIYKRVKRYRLDEFERIQARQANRRSTVSTNSRMYAVELSTKDGKKVLVSTEEHESAKKLRATLAAMLGLKRSRKAADNAPGKPSTSS